MDNCELIAELERRRAHPGRLIPFEEILIKELLRRD